MQEYTTALNKQAWIDLQNRFTSTASIIIIIIIIIIMLLNIIKYSNYNNVVVIMKTIK